VIPAAALLGAFALAAGDPCLATDEAGRRFATCFDPGNGLELGAGVRAVEGGGPAAELAAAWRWRRDTTRAGGAREWLRDQAVLDGDLRWQGGRLALAEGVAWRGVFVRRLAEPFVLLPGPHPVRLPFPFDVGMAVEAGRVRWERSQDAVEVEVVRTTLLLDVARHLGPLRRAAFGPEVAYDVSLARGRAPAHAVIPFTAAALDLAAESPDGLWRGALAARGGGRLAAGGGGLSGFAEGRLRLERVVAAINDRPLALGLALEARHGAGPARLEAAAVLRLSASAPAPAPPAAPR
jgi:hypothetical protein